ncbi:MAG: SatD family protein [Thermodesulfobacteriota bacterium]
MERVVAVVTCDIVRSQRYSTEQRRKIDTILKKEFTAVSKTYKNAIHTPTSFNVTVGDEFQFVLSRAEKAYELTVFYRALVALADFPSIVNFRSSIGIGEIAVEHKKDSYSQDGQAFHRSRNGINFFRDRKYRGKRRTKIVTGDANLDETLDIVLMYQDLLEEKWTQAQWEAIRWRLVLSTYEEIANKLGVAYQNVQKRLKAANWDEFGQGMDFVEKVLASHLQKGVTSNFTPNRVQ